MRESCMKFTTLLTLSCLLFNSYACGMPISGDDVSSTLTPSNTFVPKELSLGSEGLEMPDHRPFDVKTFLNFPLVKSNLFKEKPVLIQNGKEFTLFHLLGIDASSEITDVYTNSHNARRFWYVIDYVLSPDHKSNMFHSIHSFGLMTVGHYFLMEILCYYAYVVPEDHYREDCTGYPGSYSKLDIERQSFFTKDKVYFSDEANKQHESPKPMIVQDRIRKLLLFFDIPLDTETKDESLAAAVSENDPYKKRIAMLLPYQAQINAVESLIKEHTGLYIRYRPIPLENKSSKYMSFMIQKDVIAPERLKYIDQTVENYYRSVITGCID